MLLRVTENDQPVVNDTVGGKEVVVFWQPGAPSALDGSSIDDSCDVGMAALYDRQLDGQALDGELASRQLAQEIAFPHFWFAWAAFQPETTIYGLD